MWVLNGVNSQTKLSKKNCIGELSTKGIYYGVEIAKEMPKLNDYGKDTLL